MARPDKARETPRVFTEKATGRGCHKGYIIKKIFTPVPLVFRCTITVFVVYATMKVGGLSSAELFYRATGYTQGR
ncbi:MAG: hypothetical protein Ta2B_10760 [Termitinemataceae bacterium]|nr:MAG: hypothetical protein Ta2B_10760 [Termitinemataceae bacterium]